MTTTDATSSTPDCEGLLLEEREQVLSVRFAHPERANALTPEMLEGLVAVFTAPGETVRAVLLGGVGDRHFSSGIDLGDRGPDDLVDHLPAQEKLLMGAADAIAACEVPVIGVINGAAFGGALELAIACDWRIAASGARFGMPAARLGVVYSPEGLARFVQALGSARAKELFLTGTPIDAARAEAIGLVEHVVDGADLWGVAENSAAAISASGPIAIEGTRATINALAHGTLLAEVREAAAAARQRAFTSPDFREALAAFREKRSPRFRRR